jgi:hypothetical protein
MFGDHLILIIAMQLTTVKVAMLSGCLLFQTEQVIVDFGFEKCFSFSW